MTLAKTITGVLFSAILGASLLLSLQARPTMGDPTLVSSALTTSVVQAANPSIIDLGRALFNDTTLSNPSGQSCASCHGAAAGFKFPSSKGNVLSGIPPGAVKGRFPNRIPPTITYAQYLPVGPPAYTSAVEAFQGGLFWDGSALNLNDQAHFPLENPDEMNGTIDGEAAPSVVVENLINGPNAGLFRQVYGAGVFQLSTSEILTRLTQAIAAYELSPEISPFSSKYDAWVHGDATFTDSELRGIQMFTGSETGRPGGPRVEKYVHCSDCHNIPYDNNHGPDLWTNSCYDNIGVPKNPNNPYYTETDSVSNPGGYNPDGADYVDLGLGDFFYPFQYNLPPGNMGDGSDGEGDFLGINGDFKAPTLRNVDKRPTPGFVKAYTHNGYFKDLKTLVHFYNTRNLTTVPGEVIDFTQDDPYAGLQGTPLWPKPEYSNQTTLQNPTGATDADGGQVGNLQMTDQQEDDIVAFLKTLTDGYGKGYPANVSGVPTAINMTANNAVKATMTVPSR